jgi:tight adherence protein B
MALGSGGVAASLMVGLGLALSVVGVLLRAQRRTESLAELLDLAGGEHDVPVEAVTETPAAPSVGTVTARLGEVFGRLDTRGSVARLLDRASLPLRPGEFLFLAGAASLIGGFLLGVVVGSLYAGVAVAVLIAFGARFYLTRRARRRRETLRSQLPEAFSLIASAVVSGHTFLRSIQLLKEQISAPLDGEFHRVVAEVTLGSNLIDALERMAQRTEVEELRWAVQAVRIQQTTGGQLGELLHTLADFMRARAEVSDEVRVLSAEGRISAWVLIALPILTGMTMEVTAPHYLDPMFRGWGFFWLGLSAALLVGGYLVIRRLIDIEV